MALIDCQECGNRVSDSANSCPKCGSVNRINKENYIDKEEKFGSLECFQLLFSSGTVGFIFQSWWVFGGILITLIVIYMIPFLGDLVITLAASAALYLWVNRTMGQEAAIVISGLVAISAIFYFVCQVYLHFSKKDRVNHGELSYEACVPESARSAARRSC